MTYNEWEQELLLHLKACSKSDRDAAIEYYREMHGDKSEAGMSDEEIIKTFGSAKLAAAKILMDSPLEDSKEEENEITAPNKADNAIGEENSTVKNHGISVSKIIGWFFLITLVIIPIAAIIASVIASLGAVTAAGGAMVICGSLGAVASPFLLIFGNTGLGVLASFGTCLACAGVGILLFISFYYITKYTVITTVKITKRILRNTRNK